MKNCEKWKLLSGCVAVVAWLFVCAACNKKEPSVEYQEDWLYIEDSKVEESVNRDARHEEHKEPFMVPEGKTRRSGGSGYSSYSYDDDDDDDDKTDNEAYIDGFLTAEEEFYTGAEPGSSLPVEGDDDYEEDYDDGYGY